MENKIPASERPFLGLRLGKGTNEALTKACKQMDMSRSEFARYCIVRTLQELSLVSEQMHSKIGGIDGKVN